MQITTTDNNDYTTINFTGRLDSVTSESAAQWISTFTIEPDKPVLINFADLEYISSAGLRIIFNFTRTLKKNGCKFAICEAQDYIREIFEISGFDTFIPMINSPADFLK